MDTIEAAFITQGMKGKARANTFNEVGDAGQTLDTAQVVSGVAGRSLIRIDGNISFAGDVDLFQIFITGGGKFSAEVNFFNDFNGTSDSQLFLFNSDGLGVYANDDIHGPFSLPLSLLPAYDPLTPIKSGLYYLAISDYNNDPLSSLGKIFSNIADGVVGPTGPGGTLPLTRFDNMFSIQAIGPYSINLTGAEFIATTHVPEPFLG